MFHSGPLAILISASLVILPVRAQETEDQIKKEILRLQLEEQREKVRRAAIEAKAAADKAASDATLQQQTADAAAKEATAKADLAAANARTAAIGADVSAGSTAAKISEAEAAALQKQGEALSKFLAPIDATKIRPGTPASAALASYQLSAGTVAASCLANKMATGIASAARGACKTARPSKPAASSVALITDAAKVRPAVRAYVALAGQVIRANENLSDALNGGPGTQTKAFGAIASIGALVQLGGSVASLVSALKSVYATGSATSTNFEDRLQHAAIAAVVAAAGQPRLEIVEVDSALVLPPSLSNAAASGLSKDIDTLAQTQRVALTSLREANRRLAELKAKLSATPSAKSGPTSSPSAGTVDAAQEEIKALEAKIKGLTAATAEAAALLEAVLTVDASTKVAPVAIIPAVETLAKRLTDPGQCTYSLEVKSVSHVFDTIAQDSALQFHRRQYMIDSGAAVWRLIDEQGVVVGAGQEATTPAWRRADENKSDESAACAFAAPRS